MIFVAWYTYDDGGRPTWYVASECRLVGVACSGPLYEVTNGRPLTRDWDSPMLQVRQVGAITLTFTNNDSATLAFNLNGASGTKLITRQVFASTAPVRDVSDLWWNESESGWGMGIAAQGSLSFVTIYTYDGSGAPTWYVASACNASTSGCSGDLFRVSGGQAPTVPWRGQINVTRAGSISVAYEGSAEANMSFMIDGTSSSRRITRQAFEGYALPAVQYTDVFDAMAATQNGSFRQRGIRVTDGAAGSRVGCIEYTSQGRDGLISIVQQQGGVVTVDTGNEFCAQAGSDSVCMRLIDNVAVMEERQGTNVFIYVGMIGLAQGRFTAIDQELAYDPSAYIYVRSRESSWHSGAPCPTGSEPTPSVTAINGNWLGYSFNYTPGANTGVTALATMSCANQVCTVLGTTSATVTFNNSIPWRTTTSSGRVAGATMSSDGTLVSAYICSAPFSKNRTFESCTFYAFKR